MREKTKQFFQAILKCTHTNDGGCQVTSHHIDTSSTASQKNENHLVAIEERERLSL